MTWGELTKKNHKALYVTVFKDLGLQPTAYNVLLELLLQKEITVAILATHFTGAKLGLAKKRKAARRPVTLPPHLRRLRNKKGTKERKKKRKEKSVSGTLRVPKDLSRETPCAIFLSTFSLLVCYFFVQDPGHIVHEERTHATRTCLP